VVDLLVVWDNEAEFVIAIGRSLICVKTTWTGHTCSVPEFRLVDVARVVSRRDWGIMAL